MRRSAPKLGADAIGHYYQPKFLRARYVHLGAAGPRSFRLAQLHGFKLARAAARSAPGIPRPGTASPPGRRRAAGRAPQSRRPGRPGTWTRSGPRPHAHHVGGHVGHHKVHLVAAKAGRRRSSTASSRKSPWMNSTPGRAGISSRSSAITRPLAAEHAGPRTGSSRPGPRRGRPRSCPAGAAVRPLDLLELEGGARAPALRVRTLHVRIGGVLGEPAGGGLGALGHGQGAVQGRGWRQRGLGGGATSAAPCTMRTRPLPTGSYRNRLPCSPTPNANTCAARPRPQSHRAGRPGRHQPEPGRGTRPGAAATTSW